MNCFNQIRPLKTQIPDAYLDLVNGPPVAALTTVMPDGQPQTTVVWCNFDGRHVLVNTMRGFRKEKNMRLNPKVTLLCYDPRQPLRSLEVRGTVVEMTEAGALEHLDGLCERYTGKSPYFGACVPARLERFGAMQQATYPVQFSVDYPDRPPDRMTSFFRIFLVIPIAIVLGAVEGGSWQ